MTSPSSERWFFFDDAERRLVAEKLDLIAQTDERDATLLRGNLARLTHLAVAIRDSPPISASLPARGAQGEFSSETLIDLLCRVPDYDFDLNIPTKAVLGQAFLIAKVNFFKAVGYSLESIGEGRSEVDDEIAQSIYSKLAEELLTSIVSDPGALADAKRAAAQALFRIWERRLSTEIDDFAPYLEAIWQARDRLRPVLGTMRGTQEMLGLMRDARDSRALEYFTQDVPLEQLQAFEEFLFGISHEEIVRLRTHLEEHARAVVSSDEARELLGRRKDSWLPKTGAQAVYSSYKKRRVRATYRLVTQSGGPKRTAEEYVMTAFLLRGV